MENKQHLPISGHIFALRENKKCFSVSFVCCNWIVLELIVVVNFCLVWCFNFISRFHPRDSMHRIYWTGLFTHSALARPTSGLEPSTTQILLLEKRLFRTRMIKIWPWCVARRKITLWLKMKKFLYSKSNLYQAVQCSIIRVLLLIDEHIRVCS